MSSKYSSNRTNAQAALNLKLRKGLMNFGGDVIRLSTAATPFDKGDLRIRRQVVATAKGARIKWLSAHAAVQNRGFRTGARPFQHYTTPGTGSHFVEAGIKAASAHLREYFK